MNGFFAGNGAQKVLPAKKVCSVQTEAPSSVSTSPKPSKKDAVERRDEKSTLEPESLELSSLKLEVHKLRLSNMNYRRDLENLRLRLKFI